MRRRAFTALLALALAFGLGWTLAADASKKKPAPTPAPAPAPASGRGAKCKVAKDCSGELPRVCLNCTSGMTHCAHWTCDDSICNVTICPTTEAKPAPPPKPAPQCKVAKDCKGAVPKLCQTCKNGKTACAHHACTANTCVTEVCPP